jgi:hypothetical protein
MANTKTELDKINETGKRTNDDRRKPKTEAESAAKKPAVERRKVKRRRQIDPTTCEREYSDYEIEFMQAMDEYKRASGRMFPTCSEILEVLTNLGYRKVAEEQAIYDPNGQKDVAAEEDLDSADEQMEEEQIV